MPTTRRLRRRLHRLLSSQGPTLQLCVLGGEVPDVVNGQRQASGPLSGTEFIIAGLGEDFTA
jgi:hypothetical protein